MYKDCFKVRALLSVGLLIWQSRVRAPPDLPNRKQGSFAHSPSLSPAHRPNMTEILLKRTQNFKLFIHPSIHTGLSISDYKASKAEA